MGGIGHVACHLIEELFRKTNSGDHLTVIVGPDLPNILNVPVNSQFHVQSGMIDPHFEQHHLPHVLDGLQTDVYLNMTFSVPAIAGRTAQIAVIHDVVFEERPDLVEHRLGNYLRQWSRIASATADHIITVSDDARRRIQMVYGIADDRITRIYNGHIHTPQPGSHNISLHQFHLEPPYLLYLGSIEPKKGLVQLLDAFSDPELDRCFRSLVLVGGVSGPAFDIDDRIRRHRRFRDIRRLGYVTDHGKIRLYAGAHVFVYPSLYEGFGLPPLEALAYGIPCVVNEGTSLPEVVGDVGLTVDVEHRSSFVSALTRAATDPHVRSQARQQGPAHVARFRWDHAAQQYWTLCHDVWRQRSSRAVVA